MKLQQRVEPILRDNLALDRTRLANQRTLLAYMRTAIMLIATGVTFLELFKSETPYVVAGGICLGLSFLSFVLGVISFFRTRRRIESAYQ